MHALCVWTARSSWICKVMIGLFWNWEKRCNTTKLTCFVWTILIVAWWSTFKIYAYSMLLGRLTLLPCGHVEVDCDQPDMMFGTYVKVLWYWPLRGSVASSFVRGCFVKSDSTALRPSCAGAGWLVFTWQLCFHTAAGEGRNPNLEIYCARPAILELGWSVLVSHFLLLLYALHFLSSFYDVDLSWSSCEQIPTKTSKASEVSLRTSEPHIRYCTYLQIRARFPHQSVSLWLACATITLAENCTLLSDGLLTLG